MWHHQRRDGTQREKIPVTIFVDPVRTCQQVALHVAATIQTRAEQGHRTALALSTGSTCIGVYRELGRLHREEAVDFSTVEAFCLGEYYPMPPAGLQSCRRYLREKFLDLVNIPAEQVHFLDSSLAPTEVDAHCAEYDRAIRQAGGFDLALLSIGKSGQIAFSEPGASAHVRTRLVTLDGMLRKIVASAFYGEENVPLEALTVGVRTILEAKEILFIATGEHKSSIVRRVVEDPRDNDVVASHVQTHPNAALYADAAAAWQLTRERTPWLVVRDLKWDLQLARRAVIWLSGAVGKALLRLEAADFHANRLHGLLHAFPDIEALCLRVFEDLRKSICYLDGLPKKERAILFSPHPDDDVISMGGMLDKLVRNGNEVTVAYMTNGSVAVFDADLHRYLSFVEMSLEELGMTDAAAEVFRARKQQILESFCDKQPGQVDLAVAQKLKASIRCAEAISGIEVMGLSKEHARFLDLPFYRTGSPKKKPVGQADVQIIYELLRQQNPHHLFVAGDLSDPHGTHRLCYDAIARALIRYNRLKDHALPKVWLYRGAWQEWEIHQASVFVPMSKADMARKIEAIFKHESQKDRAMFPGAHDEREFWERARDRNTGTADRLNRLGLPEFFAAEAFVTTYSL